MKIQLFLRACSIIFIILLLTATQTNAISLSDAKLDEKVYGNNYNTIFSKIFSNLIDDLGVKQQIGVNSENIYTSFDQGLALVTLMKLYDVFNDDKFLQFAENLSDFIATSLIDLRYSLVASYYDEQRTFISNYRNVLDNVLIAWGLDQLSNRIDQNDELNVKDQKERSDYIIRDLDLFLTDNKLVDSFRVDAPTVPLVFNTFNNLITSFFVSESNSELFLNMDSVILKIYDFVDQNMTNDEGGVYSLYYKGYHDSIITLRNTALFANLALNLYSATNDNNYLNKANQSLMYIQDYFSDIGITRGYIEALENGEPKQQSKSLFSHALVLIAWLKLVNAGDKNAKLEVLSTWNTISKYFKVEDKTYYYSTIQRSGFPGSNVIRTADNLMMLYALSQMPIISKVEFLSEVTYGDFAIFNITCQIPEGFSTDIIVKFDDEIKETEEILGTGEIQNIIIELTPPKPKEDSRDVDIVISLKTQILETDYISSSFIVKLEPGINLSVELITIFSILLIIVFVLFLNKVIDIEKLSINQN